MAHPCNSDEAFQIEVDGRLRPTVNNEGRLIHPTEDGVRNFWRWFGDSQAVDAQGRPLVMYHGTGADVSEFVLHKWGERYGFYFTTSAVYAERFAESKAEDITYAPQECAQGANVMPVFLSLRNPVDVREGWPPKIAEALDYVVDFEWLTTWPSEEFWNAMDGELGKSMQSALEELGYDGLIAFEWGHPVYVAFDSGQIKSAIGNTGAFDPRNPSLTDQITGLRHAEDLQMDAALDDIEHALRRDLRESFPERKPFA